MSDRQAWWLGFLGTIALAIAFVLCVFLIFSDADAQPAQGFGPTFDPTNLALRVNVVAGAAGGLSPTSFGTAFPNGGAAVGGKDPNGAFASLTISSTGRLQVTCDNCSSSAASFGTAYPSSGGAIGYKDSLGAFASVTGSNGGLNVNVLSGGGGSSTFGTAFPTSGVPGGYRDANGALASFSGSNGKQNVIVGNESTLIATANQGSSASVANAWPVVAVSDAGVMVRPGDPVNKALRVNVVAGASAGGTSSNYGTVFPSAGTPTGYKDANGAFASVTGSNGGLNVNVLSGGGGSATYGTAFPSTGAVGFKDALGAYASVTLSNGLPVNIVQGAATDAPYGTAAPTSGLPGGFTDGNGAFASVTTTNGLPVFPTPGSSIAVSSSALPVGASTELTLQGVNTSVQNVETAIRETTAVWDTALPIGGVLIGTKDSSSGLTASLNSTNGRLQVTCDNCSSSNGTFGAAFPSTGSPAGFKDANGAFASVTSTTGLPVNIIAGAATDAPYGTAHPSSGLPTGFKDASGAFASITLTNGLPVNIVAGGGSGGTSSNYGTAFPTAGTAAGFKDSKGAMASATVDNTGAQNVNVIAGSTLIATANQGASAVVANAWPIVNVSDSGVMVRAGDDVNKALRVNVVAGGTSNSAFGTLFPTTGIAAGYKDTNGAFASFSGSNGKLNVIVGNESTIIATVTGTVAVTGSTIGTVYPTTGIAAGFKDSKGALASATVDNIGAQNVNVVAGSTLIATANQGASAVVANGWPVVFTSDGGVMVRPGDDTNKALRVNVVAGGTTGATFGTAFPTTGSPAGYRDSSGAFASFTGINGAGGSIRYDSAGRELGSSIRGKQSVPDIVQLAPQLPSNTITLGAKQTTIVNVPSGQAPGTPLRGITVGGGLATQGWAQPWVRCDRTASISVSNSGMTQIVGAVNGQTIYVCGYTAVAATTPVGIAFSYGTGTDCGTLSGDLTGSMTVAASGGMVNANSPIPYFETPASQALCVKLSNGASVGGHLRYAQF